MTVKELKELLNGVDENLEVACYNDKEEVDLKPQFGIVATKLQISENFGFGGDSVFAFDEDEDTKVFYLYNYWKNEPKIMKSFEYCIGVFNENDDTIDILGRFHNKSAAKKYAEQIDVQARYGSRNIYCYVFAIYDDIEDKVPKTYLD